MYCFCYREKVLAYTCSLLVEGGHHGVIHRGGWPEGRGSARTLVAGGLPLSDGERVHKFGFANTHRDLYISSLSS